jgi:Cu/Zn superoxide dismutase
MKFRFAFLLFALFLAFAIAPVLAQNPPTNALATLYNSSGTVVGSVSFTQSSGFVAVIAQFYGLLPGVHALEIHAAGLCDASGAFASAGSTLNPTEAAYPNRAGDLPSLLVMQNGSAYLSTATDRISLENLFDSDGTSVLIHANGDGGEWIACGTVAPVLDATSARNNLTAIQALPLELLPASVSREDNAEHGTLILSLPALGGVQIVGQITSGAAGQIGEVHQEGDILIFTFSEITYDIAPIELPGGLVIGPQTIQLDPSQASSQQINLTTGEISRNFHWLQTATDVLYDGQPTITLGDTGRSQIASVTHLGGNRYAIRMLTHWQSAVTLQTWTIGNTTLPSGEIQASAEFDGTYIIDFDA